MFYLNNVFVTNVWTYGTVLGSSSVLVHHYCYILEHRRPEMCKDIHNLPLHHKHMCQTCILHNNLLHTRPHDKVQRLRSLIFHIFLRPMVCDEAVVHKCPRRSNGLQLYFVDKVKHIIWMCESKLNCEFP